ncbi:MAG: DUF123 domain-containing protein [Bellilinea sp.]|nr:DUF123 domain-containing protein [Bellilinea sp.]
MGVFGFPAGMYVYCGSAFGSGGLRGRLGHHLNDQSPCHWHVDYLRPYSKLFEVIYSPTDERLECRWSQFFLMQTAAFLAAPHFGASDCKSGCSAHLIGFPENKFSEILRKFTLAWNCQRLPMQ